MKKNIRIEYIGLLLASLLTVGCSQKENSPEPTKSTNLTGQENTNVEIPKQQLVIEGGGASVMQPRERLRPRVVIPNTPGNIKNLLETLAAKSGYTIDWRLKGYYNLDQKALAQYNQPIGFTLPLITDLMTYANKTMKAYWGESNPGENFPYPTDVAFFVCNKSILLFEMENPKPHMNIQTSVAEILKKPEYKGCFIPDVMLGMNISIPTTSNSGMLTVNPNIELPNVNQAPTFDFNSPPPFVGEQNTGVQLDIQNVMPEGMTWSAPKNQSPVKIPIDSLK